MSSIDLSKSYLSWGPTESVTFTARRRSANHTITVANAKRGALTITDKTYLSGIVSLNGNELVWQIHATQLQPANFSPVLTSFDPQEGDWITDLQSRVYFVLPAGWDLLSYGTRWKFLCNKQR